VVLVTFEEDVQNIEAYAGEHEVEQGAAEGFAMLGAAKIVVVDVPGERFVRAVCYRGVIAIEEDGGLLTDSRKDSGDDVNLDNSWES
jgi:hypothetical protein